MLSRIFNSKLLSDFNIIIVQGSKYRKVLHILQGGNFVLLAVTSYEKSKFVVVKESKEKLPRNLGYGSWL